MFTSSQPAPPSIGKYGAGAIAEIANLAAGVKIGKIGTAAVGPTEVLAWQSGVRGAAKTTGLAESVARLEHERTLGRRIVFTNGCFDLLHAGHVHLLEKAKALGDLLVVAVNSDASVRRLKGEGRPLMAQADRVAVWKEDMSEADNAEFEEAAGYLLDDLGYETATPKENGDRHTAGAAAA